MKTRKKSGKGLYLQKSNKRWKWMAGATAATAAGVTASDASTITINLTGNYISASGGNHLNADLTGDGHPDLTLANAFHALINTYNGYPKPTYFTTFFARVSLNGILASAFRRNTGLPSFGSERLGSRNAYFLRGYCSSGPCVFGTYQLTGSIPLFFKDLHINGGAPTMGSLQVTVSTRDGAEIQLNSFSYNSPVQPSSLVVPDKGSSLMLLAMGAGGVLALRRWRAAQGRS